MSDIEIRPFIASDASSVARICYDTGFLGAPASCYWQHKESFVQVWLSRYIQAEPQSLFVALKNGVVVGYLSGCVDSRDFPSIFRMRRQSALRYMLYFRPGCAPYFWRLLRDALADRWKASAEKNPVPDLNRWPSHLHINLLPEARGSGVGGLLLNTYLGYLTENGSPGCHLGTVAENVQAIEFFRRFGFRQLGGLSPVQGLRDIKGARLHKLVMVCDLEALPL